MARILSKDQWYEAVSPRSMFEAEYERVLLHYSSALFPRHRAVLFKVSVSSKIGTAQADLALIETSLREWWVVEVEISSHSLDSHVLPQVRILADAAYGVEAADALAAEAPDLERSRLSDLIKGRQPGVLVVVNEEVPEWPRALMRYGARLTVVEVFRSFSNEIMLRVDGARLLGTEESLTTCRVDSTMRGFLKVDAPAVLEQKSGEFMSIRYGEGTTRWKRLDTSDSVYLIPDGKFPLSSRTAYRLSRDEDGKLLLEEVTGAKGGTVG